jgi:2-polyprenyl-3-methyl-5-hydroxy-6-metoxy-1,4-benzoquinol methylase
MDDPGLSAREHEEALAGLATINRVSGTVGALWRPLKNLANRFGPLRVLDIACGGGDVAVALAGRAKRRGVPLTIHGCDLSQRALEVARDGAKARGLEMEFLEYSALGEELPAGYDVYISTLFLHHLSDERAVELLRRMATGRAFIVDDLRRTKLGYALARWPVRLLTRSPVVHNDAVVSVKSAFTCAEARRLLERSSIEGARIQTHWPQRFQIRWTRPDGA